MLGSVVKFTGTVLGLSIVSGTTYYLGYEGCRAECPGCKSLSETLFEKKSKNVDN